MLEASSSGSPSGGMINSIADEAAEDMVECVPNDWAVSVELILLSQSYIGWYGIEFAEDIVLFVTVVAKVAVIEL